MIAALALAMILLASPALAQDVDIQCWCKRVATGGVVSINAQVVQANGQFCECNQPMPYVVPASQWFCLTDAEGSFYKANNEVGGDTAYANLMHDEPGHHGYHSVPVPPNRSSVTAMAFPPGGKTLIKVAIQTVGTWGRFRYAGYLGRDASATRETACR